MSILGPVIVTVIVTVIVIVYCRQNHTVHFPFDRAISFLMALMRGEYALGNEYVAESMVRQTQDQRVWGAFPIADHV